MGRARRHDRALARPDPPLLTVHHEGESARLHLEGLLHEGVDVGRGHEAMGFHAQLATSVLAARVLGRSEEGDRWQTP